MRCGNEELIDWVIKTVLAARQDGIDYRDSNMIYADNLLEDINGLIAAERGYELPGGTTYSSYIKGAILNVKYLIQHNKIPGNLASQRLKMLSDKLNEAIKIFKSGK